MDDELAIHAAFIVAGALAVASGVLRGGALGAGFTLGALAFGLGVIGVVTRAWRASRIRVPRARVVR